MVEEIIVTKDLDTNMTVKELQGVLEKLIKDGKGDYTVHTEGFCCGTNGIEVCDKHREICILQSTIETYDETFEK